MSDNEVQNKSSLEASSSADESSVSEAKASQVSEEPMRQRKGSTSSEASSSSEAEEPQADSEDESSVSKSVSKSESINEASVSSESASAEPQPPQPRSRSVSVEEAVSPPAPAERKKSSASEKCPEDIAEDTDEDVDKEDLEAEAKEATPEPKEATPEPREATPEPKEASPEPREATPEPVEAPEPVPVPRKASVEAELTSEEVELSKRETVHLDEAEKAEVIAEVTRKSSTDSSVSSSDSEPPVEAKPAIIEEVVNGQNGHNGHGPGLKVEAASSDEDEVAKAPSSPLNGRRSATGGAVTKIYTNAVDNNNKSINNNNNIEKRGKPTRDITQIYTQTLAKTTPPASPKSAPRSRPATDITKLYTGKLDARAKTPEPEKAGPPKKHNMSTAVDKDAIRGAYDDVRSDTTDTEWAVFKFDQSNRLGVTATGNDFADFKSHFGNADRGFGYIRIKTGDEMSKRAKFILVTWVGPEVSVMKKAKMSTDKALMKDICQNMSVELQLETHGEFSHDNFKLQVDKASGARYGTGVRDL